MTQAELHDYLERINWWRPFPKGFPEPLAEKKDRDEEQRHEAWRRHMLRPDPRPKYSHSNDPRKLQPEFHEGRRARKAKKRRSQNPYPVGRIAHELWFLGWEAAAPKK